VAVKANSTIREFNNTEKKSYVSDKTTKEKYPFGLNVRYNVCPIIPQNKDSNQVLLYSMHTTKGSEVSNNSSKGRNQLLIMLPSSLREFTYLCCSREGNIISIIQYQKMSTLSL